MQSARAEGFRREIAGLDSEALAGFVAELWAARGYEILAEREGEIVVDCRSADPQTLLVSSRPNRFVLSWLVGGTHLNRADAVVTSQESVLLERIAERTQTELLGPAELYRLATYATNTRQETQLYRDFFDGPPPTKRGSGPRRTSDRLGAFVPEWLSRSTGLPFPPQRHVSVRNVAILLCCCLLVAGLVSAHSVGPPAADPPDGVDDGGLPPHLAAAEEGNVSQLLTRHEAMLDGKSPDLYIVHDGTREKIISQRRWQWSRQRLSVENGTEWQFEVSGELEPATIGSESKRVHLVIEDDGGDCSTRSVESMTGSLSVEPCLSLTDDNTSSAADDLSRTYLSEYLSDTSLRVVPQPSSSGERYEVVSTDPPSWIAPGVRNYSARAVVTPAGVVEEFDVSYRLSTDHRGEQRSLALRLANHTGKGKSR